MLMLERIKSHVSTLTEVRLASPAAPPSTHRTCFHSEIKSTVTPFLFLAVDLPPPPLFQDSLEKNIIPQVSIHSVLAKYDGRTTQVSHDPSRPLQRMTRSSGICRPIAAVQVSTSTSLYHLTLQAVHEKCICRGEESNHRKLSPTRA